MQKMRRGLTVDSIYSPEGLLRLLLCAGAVRPELARWEPGYAQLFCLISFALGLAA